MKEIINNLLERVSKLEKVVFPTIDRQYVRYIAFTDDDNRILTHGGFKRLDKLNEHTIRIFQTPNDVKRYLNNHCTYYKLKVTIKKVRVSYEYMNDVERVNFDEDE